MKLRLVLWWHFGIVILFAAFAILDGLRSNWYGSNQWLTEVTTSQIFLLLIGSLGIVAVVSLVICPFAVIVLVASSKLPAKGKAAALIAEMLLVVGQIVTIIPTIQ